jgi:hypothetical protein
VYFLSRVSPALPATMANYVAPAPAGTPRHNAPPLGTQEVARVPDRLEPTAGSSPILRTAVTCTMYTLVKPQCPRIALDRWHAFYQSGGTDPSPRRASLNQCMRRIGPSHPLHLSVAPAAPQPFPVFNRDIDMTPMRASRLHALPPGAMVDTRTMPPHIRVLSHLRCALSKPSST